MPRDQRQAWPIPVEPLKDVTEISHRPCSVALPQLRGQRINVEFTAFRNALIPSHRQWTMPHWHMASEARVAILLRKVRDGLANRTEWLLPIARLFEELPLRPWHHMTSAVRDQDEPLAALRNPIVNGVEDPAFNRTISELAEFPNYLA